jgi:hypothetical protein
MTEVTFKLPPADHLMDTIDDDGTICAVPQWKFRCLAIADAIAWGDGVEIGGVFYEPGDQIDEIEADALKLLAAITAVRRHATQLEPVTA